MKTLSMKLPNLSVGERPGVENLLSEAVLWLDPQFSVAGEQEVVNKGTGGAVLNARYGSGTGSDTNDPTLLTHDEDNYLYLSGDSENGLQNSSLAIPTGAIRVTAKFSVLTHNNDKIIVGDRVSNNCGAWLRTGSSSGIFSFTRGTGVAHATSSLSVPLINQQTLPYIELEVTHDGTTAVPTFRYRNPGTDWVNGVGGAWSTPPSPIVSSAGAFAIGGESAAVAGRNFLGKIYSVKIENLDTDTTFFEFNGSDFTASTTTSFVATSGQTLTVKRSAAGKKACLVTRPVWLFGTDDYLQVLDNALLNFDADDEFTVLALSRQWATPSSSGRLFSKKGAGAGWTLYQNGTTFNQYFEYKDPANPTLGLGITGPTVGAINLTGVAFNSTERRTILDGVVSAPGARGLALDLSNSDNLNIGASNTPGNYINAEIFAALIFRKVLSQAEVSALLTYLQRV